MTAHRTGVLLLITTVICWGLTWPVHKVLLESLPPVWSVALRTAIGMVTLFALGLLRGRLPRPARADLPVLLSITILHMVGFTLLSTWGLQQVTAGRSVVLAYTTPLWVTPGAVLFLGERLTARRVVSVALGLLGLAALFNPMAFDWSNRRAVLGNLAILAAAFLWAGSILHIRAHRWHGTPFELLPWEILLATVILLTVGFATTPFPAVDWNPRLVLMLLYAGIPGVTVAYWAVAMASRNLPAVTTSLGLLMTPVISVVTATLWLGETPTLSLIAAIVLILGGVALGATGSPTARRDAAERPGE
jgi:drug/metabolite transporter (DMT)-like permease